MARITTVDYSKLEKQSVGRPKTSMDKGNPSLLIELKTNLSKNFIKVKFKIRKNKPSIYFTNRETNIINESEYLNDIINDSFFLQYSNLKEGIYNIVPTGYHWFELIPVEAETDNCCIVNKIKE